MRIDVRKLTHSELTALRKRGVAAVQSGETPATVARVLGVTRKTIYNWLSLYRRGGWDALNASKRGGRKPKLDGVAIQWVYELVTGGDPGQMKFPFALWTCPLIAKAIRMKFKIKLSRWSVARLLAQLGLSPQKPLRRAYQQKPEAVDDWKKKTYPKIRREAKRVGAEIYFLDESFIRSDYHAGTTWSQIGKTPVVKTTGARFSLNMIAAITGRGTIRFMTYKETMVAAKFIEFLKRLERDSVGPVFLVVDGHPVHRSAAVRNYVEASEGRLRLFFLPGYSPELNPVEQVWNHAKRNGVANRAITGPDQLKRLARAALSRLQKLPRIIMSFFKHPECSYAAVS